MNSNSNPPTVMARPARVSFAFIAATLLLVGWLRLATPLLAVLFSFFFLQKLQFTRNKWLAVGLFAIVLLAIAYGLAHFINHAIEAIPKIADDTIPKVIAWAENNNIELPFTDYQSLREFAIETVKEQAGQPRHFANLSKRAPAQFVFLIIGAVVAASMFLDGRLDLERGRHAVPNNMYSLTCDEIVQRFKAFYQSFATVMGAQILISTINTALTSIFTFSVGLPYAHAVLDMA